MVNVAWGSTQRQSYPLDKQIPLLRKLTCGQRKVVHDMHNDKQRKRNKKIANERTDE